jgi:APA family basic amino acid/polyamine antiporter
MSDLPENGRAPELKRVIGLPLLVLYGLGITIGAGIYVLVGAAAGEAGIHAPAAFLLAAFVMAFSAMSFAEFSGRVPQSAGEAVYVEAGFGWPWLSLLVGLSIVAAATIGGAAIALGCAGYVGVLIEAPKPVIVAVIVLAMGALAAKGIREAVGFAGILTVIEVAGLAAIVIAGFRADPDLLAKLPASLPPLDDSAALTGVMAAGLIAFFAFIGFDDVVNLVEETRDPRRTMPWAIVISLVAVTLIYVLVVLVAVNAVPLDELAATEAPIGLLFERLTGISPLTITLIAIVATLNGVVIEIIMAARVVYGLSRKGRLPAQLGVVNARTQTPLVATVLITGATLALAVFVPLDALVEMTSQVILAVFTLVNLSLVIVKIRGDAAPEGVFTVPVLVPVIGALTCVGLLVGPMLL